MTSVEIEEEQSWKWRGTKNLLMKLKEKSIKVYLKLNIEKTKNMASSPFPSWQIEGEKVEATADFIFSDSKSAADGDCSHEI